MTAIILTAIPAPAATITMPRVATESLAASIKAWGRELGFQQVGITAPDLRQAAARLQDWLAKEYHGDMNWLGEQASLRTKASALAPGAVRAISVRMNYWREDAYPALRLPAEPAMAWVSRYALGRDYHRVLRQRLHVLADRIIMVAGPAGYRVCVDSSPIMEKPLAQEAGLGWIGKHTNLINRDEGSWFFLGEVLTDLPLPVDPAEIDHCGSCRVCMDVCPTRAIVAPYVLDARRCISYLTIENTGPIPEELRPALGNRVFGCDDCQLFCPWNKFARHSPERDFAPRHGLDRETLVKLFGWTAAQWHQATAGSAIRRVGYEGWLRNLAVALGNAPGSGEVIAALRARLDDPSPMVREHIGWALSRHQA